MIDARSSWEGKNVQLPADNHVHSQYSWDALAGAMEESCEQAVALGLPSIAFTEHADFSPTPVTDPDSLPGYWRKHVLDDVLTPPEIDRSGYLSTLERCRERFPQLRILSGVELSEPHWHREKVADLVTRGGFQRVLASMHSAVSRDEDYLDVIVSIKKTDPTKAVRAYLAEAERLVAEFDGFEVLTHIDYPFRYWPRDAPPYDIADFESEIRAVLRALARAGKVLEFSTRLPMDPRILTWWRADGGAALSFASDAHEPAAVARGFREAADVARAAGFRPSDDPFAFWVRD
jgi:histidinol-phosphatase (PHP family)